MRNSNQTPVVIRGLLLLLLAGAFAAETNAQTNFSVTSSGNTSYKLNNVSNPTITLKRGTTNTFSINAVGHPFYIKTVYGDTSANAYNNGVTGNGTQFGTVTFVVPGNAPDTLFYNCEQHFSMGGTINIVDGPNAPPSVTITNPVANSIFAAPANVLIEATASDPDGSVTNVQFLVGTVVLTNDTTSPYSAVTNGLPAGGYNLTAVAADNKGAKATNVVSIIVNSAPTVLITNPPNGEVFCTSGNVVIQATAADADGSVTNVQFLVGSEILANVLSAPFQAITNGLAPGNYTLTAIAADNYGFKATNSVGVTINSPPTVSLTNPVANVSFSAPASILLGAEAGDVIGTVTNVLFLANGAPLANVNTAPFMFAASGLGAGNYSFSAVASDDCGVTVTSSVVNVSVLTNAMVSSPSLLADGQFKLTIQGIAGQSYTTEASTNLMNWTSVATNVAPANLFNITDMTSSNVLQRFYRVRQDL